MPILCLVFPKDQLFNLLSNLTEEMFGMNICLFLMFGYSVLSYKSHLSSELNDLEFFIPIDVY